MKNLLIVESENDKHFIEALIKHMNISTIEVSEGIICRIDDYECMEGLNEGKLTNALNAALGQAKKKPIKRIGFIVDQDNKTVAERIELINKAINNSTLQADNLLKDTGRLFSITQDNGRNIEIGLYLTNVDGAGELETILKAIKLGDSVYADCLQSWQECLIRHNINGGTGLKQKDFDKLWVQLFIRFDACSRKDQKRAGSKCNTQASMSKPIWNFEHECLIGMKQFLTLFSE